MNKKNFLLETLIGLNFSLFGFYMIISRFYERETNPIIAYMLILIACGGILLFFKRKLGNKNGSTVLTFKKEFIWGIAIAAIFSILKNLENNLGDYKFVLAFSTLILLAGLNFKERMAAGIYISSIIILGGFFLFPSSISGMHIGLFYISSGILFLSLNFLNLKRRDRAPFISK